MILQIEAIDTLFFRDGKPFEMGDENWANGIFLPLPSAFYGAIRTAYFSLYPQKLRDWNNGLIEDPTKDLKIRGIFLYKDTILVPIPAEFVNNDIDEDVFFQRNNLENNEEVFCNSSTLLNPYTIEVKSKQGFIEISNLSPLNSYINDIQNKKQDYILLDKLICREPKVGIGRQNSTKTTEEGKLYRVGLNRLEVEGNPNKKLSFLIDINIDVLGGNFIPPFLKLGGENKLAQCKPFSHEIKIPKPIITKRFKIAFITPAIFKSTSEGRKEGGWLPDCFVYDKTQKAYIGSWKGVNLKLLRAFITGAISIGGFDLKHKAPKAMYRAVPVGSVYHFEILDDTESEIINFKFGNFDNPLCDVFPEQGFGLSIIGQLNE